MTLPNFLVLGEQKCGTGWVRDMLLEHPDVFIASKELKFFSHKSKYARGIQSYSRHFKGVRQSVIGEKSPEYFWQHSGVKELNQDVFGLINSELPEAKLILILRDPVNRAISALQHHVEHRGRRIHPSTVYKEKLEDVFYSGQYDLDNLGVLQRSFYADRVEEAMRVFGDRLKIYLFERDVVKYPVQGLNSMCAHIGAPLWSGFRYNHNVKEAKPSYQVMLLSYYIPVLRPVFRKLDVWAPFKIKPSQQLRERMNSIYLPDVERVEGLLGTKLIGEWWLK